MTDSKKYLILTFWPVAAMVLFTTGAVYFGLNANLINWVQVSIVVAGLVGVLWKSFLDAKRAKADRMKELRDR